VTLRAAVAEQREWRRPEQAVAELHHPEVDEVDSPARAVAGAVVEEAAAPLERPVVAAVGEG
jgi:hypothetical protein